MVCPDYQLSILMEEREYNRRLSSSDGDFSGVAYFYARTIIRYMTRLLFAIGWSKIKEHTSIEDDKECFAILFKNPSEKGGKNSIEPGSFAHTLRKIADNDRCRQLVCEEIKLLGKLEHVRNDNAHFSSTLKFDPFYEDVDKAYQEFCKLFQNKICSYIIPTQNVTNGINCFQIDVKSNRPDSITLPGEPFKWSEEGARLFYRVRDESGRDTTYYNLSPFIEIPTNLHSREPQFRIYDRVADNGYGSDCDILLYDDINPRYNKIKTDNGYEMVQFFDTTTAIFRRNDMFASRNHNIHNKLWYPSINNNVYINISSYPGFGDVLQGKYKYCEEICPIISNVMNFCENKACQVAKITGNGGLGKTALALYVIKKIFNAARPLYTNIIFMSAKRRYLEKDRSTSAYHLLDHEKQADIHDYSEFVGKLSILLGIDSTKKGVEELADALVNKVNSGLGYTSFLLIIDDLDSFELAEQAKIEDLVYRFNSSNLKTIITTRNIAAPSTVSFQLSELDEKQSIAYASWFAENNIVSSWHNWSQREKAENWIIQNGEGNPMTIQMLVTLVKEGSPDSFQSDATQLERNAYLYNTVKNLLTPSEKTVFELCRQAYIALGKSYQDRDMVVFIPHYLAAGCDIDPATFSSAIKRLLDLKLIICSYNQFLFRPYSPFIISNSLVDVRDGSIPEMYSFIWAHIKKHPERWLYINNSEEALFDCLIANERETGYNNTIARKIMESIISNEYASNTLCSKIKEWLDSHAIAGQDGQVIHDEHNARLIQSIENLWLSMKKQMNAGLSVSYTDTLKLSDNIRLLMQMLRTAPSKTIEERLNIVQHETSEYGL